MAESQGDLATGDRILEVCGQIMDGLNHEEAVSVLKATPKIVQLKIEKGVLEKAASASPERNHVDVQVQQYYISSVCVCNHVDVQVYITCTVVSIFSSIYTYMYIMIVVLY